MTFIFVLLLCSLAFQCQGMPSVGGAKAAPDDYYLSDDDYSSDDYYSADDDDYLSAEEKVVHTTPTFVSTSSSQLVNEGDTIKLPCFVDKLDGFVLMWKKGKNLVALGSSLMKTNDNRVKLEEGENGNTLVILLADTKDAGEYSCQISISGGEPTEIRHSVRIRVAPQIRSIPENGHLVVYQGEPASLGCDILAGNPTPEITWRRKERKMPSGEEEARGLSMTFTSATRHHSGIYTCSADNGFGRATNKTITLDVQHAPEVETQQTFIHTAENDETEVICTVHASPKAEVVWFKDGKVFEGKQGIFAHRGNRHSIILTGINEPIYGVYKCKATNKFGSDEATTEVSGYAAPVNFKSEPVSTYDNIHHMEWVAESISPITDFKFQFKKQTDDYYYRANMIVQDGDSEKDWTEVDNIPPKSNGDNFYSGKHTLKGLEPATRYLARVSSKNDYGFNKFSQPFHFATKGAAPVQLPNTRGGSVMISCSSIGLILSTVLMSIAYQRLQSFA